MWGSCVWTWWQSGPVPTYHGTRRCLRSTSFSGWQTLRGGVLLPTDSAAKGSAGYTTVPKTYRAWEWAAQTWRFDNGHLWYTSMADFCRSSINSDPTNYLAILHRRNTGICGGQFLFETCRVPHIKPATRTSWKGWKYFVVHVNAGHHEVRTKKILRLCCTLRTKSTSCDWFVFCLFKTFDCLKRYSYY